MCAKEEQKQREELETTLKLLEKNLLTEKNQCFFMINFNKISKKYMIILRKEYASEAGVSGMK